MTIEARVEEVNGRVISALIRFASSMSETDDGDPRPGLLGALAAASLMAAEVPITQETLAPLATAISRTAAEEAEKLLPRDEQDQVPAADDAAA